MPIHKVLFCNEKLTCGNDVCSTLCFLSKRPNEDKMDIEFINRMIYTMKGIYFVVVLVGVSLNSASSLVAPECYLCNCCNEGRTNCTVNQYDCTSCLDGYWGGKCRNKCPTNCLACAKEAVYSGNGSYENGIKYHICSKCSDGWYLGNTNETMMCNLKCPEGCKSCTSLLNCDECRSGLYSEFCNESCSTNCQFENCSRENGNCIGGCKDQYSGDKCCVPNKNCVECSSEIECVVCAEGFYGPDCQHICPINCSAGCLKLSGECNSCVSDTYGIFCNGTCLDTCSRNGRSTKCDNSGKCLFGCIHGFYGKTCEHMCTGTCEDKSCDRESGTCPTRTPEVSQSVVVQVVGGVAGCVMIIVLIVCIILLIKRRKSQPETETYEGGYASAVNNDAGFSIKQEVTETKTAVATTRRKSDHKKIASIQKSQTVENEYGLEDPNEEVALEQDDGAEYTIIPDKQDYYNETLKIKVSGLYRYVQKRSKEQYKQEFKLLPNEPSKPFQTALKQNNIKKNRYAGIYPYDETRVKVKDDPDFFINANYIKGYEEGKGYIASLGPTKEATDDFKTFWQMVWNEKTDVIVLLTNLQESTGMKCEQYWPNVDNIVTYGSFTVECQSEEVFAEYTMRIFTVSHHKTKRHLRQFHYTAWPDKGVPDHVISLVEFWQQVKICARLAGGPDIIHCSAGIGRTGTFIAIDRLTDEGKASGSVNVYGCILELREQRVGMVQTPEQYIYLHKALLYTLVLQSEAISSEAVREYVDSSSTGVFVHHFQLLNKTVEEENDDEKEAKARNSKYKTNNRPGADIPGDLNRARIYFNKSFNDPDYINATFVDSLTRKNAFIVTQTPLPSTLEDFVTLLYQEECSCVVSLEGEPPNKKSIGVYLPADNQTLTVGHFTMTSTSHESKPQYLLRKLTIRHSSKAQEKKTMYHFQYLGWPQEKCIPEDLPQFLHFINDVKCKAAARSRTQSDKPILVHCLNASSKSGLFCVVAVVLEKLQAERQVSIPNTIRQIRTRRHGAIANKEQFEFCYRCAAQHTDHFAIYTNVPQ